MERQLMKCGCVAQGARIVNGDRIPSCLVHDCIEPAQDKPNLTGRIARCTYSHSNPKGRQRPGQSPVASSYDLAFFEYCGEGSREATEICQCGYHKVAHEHNGGKCPTQAGTRRPLSREFTPKGDQGFDRFYCGCFGWD